MMTTTTTEIRTATDKNKSLQDGMRAGIESIHETWNRLVAEPQQVPGVRSTGYWPSPDQQA